MASDAFVNQRFTVTEEGFDLGFDAADDASHLGKLRVEERDDLPLLGKWRDAASDPTRKDEAAKLAVQVQALLCGKRPVQESAVPLVE